MENETNAQGHSPARTSPNLRRDLDGVEPLVAGRHGTGQGRAFARVWHVLLGARPRSLQSKNQGPKTRLYDGRRDETGVRGQTMAASVEASNLDQTLGNELHGVGHSVEHHFDERFGL